MLLRIRRANDDDEVLLGLRAKLERDPLCELFADGVLNEPALVLDFRVYDRLTVLSGALLKRKRKFWIVKLLNNVLLVELESV